MKTIIALLVFLVVALLPKSALSYPKSSTQVKIEKGPVILMVEAIRESFNFDYAIEGAFVPMAQQIDKASTSNLQAFSEMLKVRREIYQQLQKDNLKRYAKNEFPEKDPYENVVRDLIKAEEAVKNYPTVFEAILEPSHFLMTRTELLENAHIDSVDRLSQAGSYYADASMDSTRVSMKMLTRSVDAVLRVFRTAGFENSLNFSYSLKLFPDTMATLNLDFDPVDLSKQDFVKAAVAERLAFMVAATDMLAGKDVREYVREVELMTALKNLLNSIQDTELRAELSVAIGHRALVQVKNPGVRFMAQKLSNLYDINEVRPLSSAREEVSMYGSYKRKKIFFVLPYDSLFAQNLKDSLAKNSWANTWAAMNISEQQLNRAMAFLNPNEYKRLYRMPEESLEPFAREVSAGLEEANKERIALIKEWMEQSSDPKKFNDIYNAEDSAKTESRQMKIIIANGVRYIIVELPYTLLRDLKSLTKKATGHAAILGSQTLKVGLQLFIPNGIRLLDLVRVPVFAAMITVWNGTPIVTKGAWYGSKKIIKLLSIDLARRGALAYSWISTQAAAKPLAFADEADRVHQKKDKLGNPILSCEAVFH